MLTTPAPVAPTVSASAPRLSTASISHASHISHLRPSRLRDLGASLRHYRQQRDHPGDQGDQGSSNTSKLTSPLPSPTSARADSAPDARPLPPQPSTTPPPPPPPTSTTTMTRNRAETAAQLTVRNQTGPIPALPSPVPSMETADHQPEAGSAPGPKGHHLPSIRLIPHQDPRPGRPSLQFTTMARTLPDENAVIRVGRYSERDNVPDIPANVPSSAPVGFKSKVVSRKHCELWCKDSQWYIKDVKSSSGTFLNRIRLSQPNEESKPFKIKDGDIIQLGIDFKGGEEMIFRCVKIRIECNRGWQQGLNTFNKQTHQRLRNLARTRKESDAASTHTSECSICLMSIAPCQSLFVAPCSHVWHYKCIRPILNGPTWPNFLCPNCRAVTDLEADVEDPADLSESWDDLPEPSETEQELPTTQHLTPRPSTMPAAEATVTGPADLSDLSAVLSNYNIHDNTNGGNTTPDRFISPTAHSSSITQPVAIQAQTSTIAHSGLSPVFPATAQSVTLNADRVPDCPMTPRNDAGPFVMDGSGSGSGSAGRLPVPSGPSGGNRGGMTFG